MTRSQFLLLTGIILLSLQCRKNDGLLPECPDCNLTCIAEGERDVFSNTCRNNYTCTFKWQENAQLDYSNRSLAQIKAGDNLVFSADVYTNGNPNATDDEFANLLYFEIDPLLDRFSVEGAELNAINARYMQSCFCAERDLKIPEGCIQGQRIDAEHWQIQANLTILYTHGSSNWTNELKIDAVFVK